MTTSANPAPTPTGPEASPSELSETWRAIGRLEGTADALLEGQRDLREGQRDLREGQRDLNRRMDRLFYTILGIGGAIIVAVFASRFVGS